MSKASSAFNSEKTIIIVDDDPNSLTLVVALAEYLLNELRLNGAAILSATSGEEAISLLRQFSIDLLITDYQMPGITGLDLIRTVRMRRSSQRITTILMSSDHDILRVFSKTAIYGTDFTLAKPVNRSALKQHLQTIFRDSFKAAAP